MDAGRLDDEDWSFFGVVLSVEEVVTVRDAPFRKEWQTIGVPRLLVMGGYSMGFALTNLGPSSCRTKIWIDYQPAPDHPLMSAAFGKLYARWCIDRMNEEAISAPE